MVRTAGQDLALSQLNEICDFSDGEVSVVEVTEDKSSLWVRVSLSTRHHERTEHGLPLNKREPLHLLIPAKFPQDYPSTFTVHKKFAGYPHVQWSTYLCLYRSPDIEWSPKDGMYGFIDRLNKWFGAAARNELDPDDAPLHPPVTYRSGKDRIVIRENTPLESQDNFWLGSAELKYVHDTRFDLVGWHKDLAGLADDNLPAAAILLNQPFPMEYPSTVKALVDQLKQHHIELKHLYIIMKVHVLQLADHQPLFVVLGTPMRRRDPNGPLRQHLAVWRIDNEAVDALRAILNGTGGSDEAISAFVSWSFDAKVEWCSVDEAREEITIGRDAGSAASWVKQKRVLLLGCGALGSYMADCLVRAGVGAITLVDRDLVSVGVLARQLFTDVDVGKFKVEATRDRLQGIAPNCDITASVGNLKHGVLVTHGRDFDLIIDATASRAVSEVLEKELQAVPVAPPILVTSVSAKAEIGRVIIRAQNASGGPKSIIRNAQLKCYSEPALSTLASAFWPKPGDIELFQPEPGCSEPTFQGSGADLGFHATGLLNAGLSEIAKNEPTAAVAMFLPKPLFNNQRNIALSRRFEFAPATLHTERNHKYATLCSFEAEAAVQSEIRRSARVNGPDVETGGLLFGEIDDNLGQLWIDQVTGPPPDSMLSPQLFVCGTDGTQARTDLQKKRSGGASQFVGIWHTHPVSPPKPSQVDLDAMHSILIENDKPPRHTVMLIVGNAASRPEWGFYIFRRNELRIHKQGWTIQQRFPHVR